MKLSTKICSSMAVLTVLMTILAGFLLMELDKVNDFVTTLAHRNIPTISVAGQYNNDMSEHRIAEVRHVYATDPAIIARIDKEIIQWREKLSAYLNTLQGLITPRKAGKSWTTSRRKAGTTSPARTKCSPCRGNRKTSRP